MYHERPGGTPPGFFIFQDAGSAGWPKRKSLARESRAEDHKL
jgi:hypothetical protein